ncbi:integrase [Aquamicrobium lusatiense]|uniref:Integrase n=1 Tax=Aquamicrobium lusatiense TaxID=89772 RepID=A0A7W9S0P6_9HYPH|nr:site-specific integrase [Aquamicrobium lusatiense]MBB6010808.1 integrase [Aquamicrobium lusatiense]
MLIDPNGKRLYLTAAERHSFLNAAARMPGGVRSFCETLHYTGCRISEALNLTVERIDLENEVIVFETLKKRRTGVFRSVPVPDKLLNTLELVHQIRRPGKANRLLWPWSRVTAWRYVKAVMKEAKIQKGPQASPKGLRHGYGVNAISSGVPLNMLSKWMGHSAIEITSIYTNAVGSEQKQISARMWGCQ